MAAPLVWLVDKQPDGTFAFSVQVAADAGEPAEQLGGLSVTEALAGHVRAIFEAFAAAGYLPRSEWRAMLDELGIELWRALPTWFHDYYWERMHGRTHDALAICSDERVIPWELVKPERSATGETAQMLGLTHAMSRCDLARPSASLFRPDVVVLAPNLDALPLAQQAEVADCEETLGGRRLDPGDSVQLVDLLGSSSPWIGHLATHGGYDRIVLADGSLGPDDLPRAALAAAAPPALIFLNVCDAGQPNWEAPDPLRGWPEAYQQAGVSAVVAPSWRVVGQIARRAAALFYGDLRSGKTIAQAARTVRRAAFAYETDELLRFHPSWLAYAAYGHPDTTVQFREE
jgi:hypothetical protein